MCIIPSQRFFAFQYLFHCNYVSFVVTLDFTQLQFFSFIGLKDALFVDSGDPWNPNPETASRVMTMLQQVHRVLKRDGIFISVAFGQVKS